MNPGQELMCKNTSDDLSSMIRPTSVTVVDTQSEIERMPGHGHVLDMPFLRYVHNIYQNYAIFLR